QTALALATLHRKGFLHGDVKPENIRLLGNGKAVLLDLGFAHRIGENRALLEEGYILGTVNYLAPELCGPAPIDDPKADVFSLGVTLFEMLAGRLPYPAGDTLQTLQRHEREMPIDIRGLRTDLPPGLAEILHGALARRPEERPSAPALAKRLL